VITERRLVIAGIGGQGVVFATKVLSNAALHNGLPVMASENHGMSQRGGSVQSHVQWGVNDAPLVRRGRADVLIGFDLTETLRNLAFVRPGGTVCVNTRAPLPAAVAGRLEEMGVTVLMVDGEAGLRELGVPGVTNLVVLGLAAASGVLGLTLDDLAGAVRTLGPARAVETNLKALALGAAQLHRAAAGAAA